MRFLLPLPHGASSWSQADHLLGVSRRELKSWLANCVQNVGGFTPGTVTSAKVQVNLVTGKPGHNTHFWCFGGWCCLKDDRIARQLLALQHLERSWGQSSCLCRSDWVTSNFGKGALHTPKEQSSTGRFSVCGQLLQCEIYELPSNMPQAQAMAEQLRESPPETAGNLFLANGKQIWDRDVTRTWSHNRHTYRHRSQTAPGEKGTLRLDTLLGADSRGKELSTISSVRTSGPHPVACCYPEYYTFSVLPMAAKSGHFSIISRLAVVAFVVHPRSWEEQYWPMFLSEKRKDKPTFSLPKIRSLSKSDVPWAWVWSPELATGPSEVGGPATSGRWWPLWLSLMMTTACDKPCWVSPIAPMQAQILQEGCCLSRPCLGAPENKGLSAKSCWGARTPISTNAKPRSWQRLGPCG